MATGDEIDFRVMLREARREIQMRRSVYGRRVLTGEMSQASADYSISIMEKIAAHLLPFATAEQAEADAIMDYKEPKML